MSETFISYSRKDSDFVRHLHDALASDGRESWIDWKAIPPTAEWWKEICSAIEQADNFLFVLSPDSCASETCREELSYAEVNHKRLLPVLHRSVKRKDLPASLARIQWITFRKIDFETAVRYLVQALDTDLDWIRLHTRLLLRAREGSVAKTRGADLLG